MFVALLFGPIIVAGLKAKGAWKKLASPGKYVAIRGSHRDLGGGHTVTTCAQICQDMWGCTGFRLGYGNMDGRCETVDGGDGKFFRIQDPTNVYDRWNSYVVDIIPDFDQVTKLDWCAKFRAIPAAEWPFPAKVEYSEHGLSVGRIATWPINMCCPRICGSTCSKAGAGQCGWRNAFGRICGVDAPPCLIWMEGMVAGFELGNDKLTKWYYDDELLGSTAKGARFQGYQAAEATKLAPPVANPVEDIFKGKKYGFYGNWIKVCDHCLLRGSSRDWGQKPVVGDCALYCMDDPRCVAFMHGTGYRKDKCVIITSHYTGTYFDFSKVVNGKEWRFRTGDKNDQNYQFITYIATKEPQLPHDKAWCNDFGDGIAAQEWPYHSRVEYVRYPSTLTGDWATFRCCPESCGATCSKTGTGDCGHNGAIARFCGIDPPPCLIFTTEMHKEFTYKMVYGNPLAKSGTVAENVNRLDAVIGALETKFNMGRRRMQCENHTTGGFGIPDYFELVMEDKPKLLEGFALGSSVCWLSNMRVGKTADEAECEVKPDGFEWEVVGTPGATCKVLCMKQDHLSSDHCAAHV